MTSAKPLAQVISGHLGIGRQSGRRTFWPCPKHEDRTPSLTICPDGIHFKCFSCGWSGDAITWVRDFEGLNFRQAVARVGARLDNGPQQANRPSTLRELPPTASIPSNGWQSAAIRIVEHAEMTLWSDVGQKPRHWLNSRGLRDETIRGARLGFIPVNGPVEGIYADSGIAIPWFNGNTIRFVQIRRYSGDPKYRAIAGGTRGGWYPQWPRPGRPLLVVEGEFDALLAGQELGDLVEAVTLGAATDKITGDVAASVVGAPTVLVATDDDPAGEKAATEWLKLTARARRAKPPAGKDITDSHFRQADLRTWILSLLPRGTPTQQHAGYRTLTAQ